MRSVYCLLGMLLALPAIAVESYQKPSPAMQDLVDAPLPPHVAVSPDHRWAAFLQRSYVTTLKDLAAEEAKLAGLRIRPSTFAPSRQTPYREIQVVDLDSGAMSELELPEGRIFEAEWSPNSRYLGFVIEEREGLHFWVHDTVRGESRRVSDRAINGVFERYYTWYGDGETVLTQLAVNAGTIFEPDARLPKGPAIQETGETKAAVRTYQDLLRDERDSAYFEFLATSQPARIRVPGGKVTELGKPGLYVFLAPSPDGRLVLAEQLQRPFSYIVPYYRFPLHSEVWNSKGKVVTTVASLPLAEDVPPAFDSARVGRRDIDWRSDLPATLTWVEAQDGGDIKADVEHHDIAYQWAHPFKSDPEVLFRFELRSAGLSWGTAETALAGEWRYSDRRYRVWKFSPDGSSEPVVFQDRSYNDEYNDPGSPVRTHNRFGQAVIQVNDDGTVFLNGRGASDEGYRPHIDRYDFETGEAERLWQSQPPHYEQAYAVLDDGARRLLISRESPTENPNFFIVSTGSDEERRITHFPHPFPEFQGVKKELIRYQRDDGIELTGTLYLPPDYQPEDGPLPVLMWAYPLEYKDPNVASQVRESPYQFNRIGFWGPLPHLAQGVAVFDDPKMPVIGEGDAEPNDNFRKQLVSSARAAVDVLVERGIADPDRIAISGHSYGAFMVANLLAHSDLFATGIARSGAYNRSLTPFGFQGEERDFWEGQSVYATMSPFFHADKVNEPILFIHGAADSNSGTYPMQSRRMFSAVKGLGGTARLVMLPYEDHGYRARESILHVLWEQANWLETHLGIY
ncbi:MAG: prolyl oligopeptidase family serine peptidase [Xanthomonadales bacterium]|nr:prolyl oligopeptidase family serine peptidase [Xanthomonadales bacterium]